MLHVLAYEAISRERPWCRELVAGTWTGGIIRAPKGLISPHSRRKVGIENPPTFGGGIRHRKALLAPGRIVRLAGAKVKTARGGVEWCRGRALNMSMQKMQLGTLRRFAIGLLLIGVLALAACSDEPTFTEAEKTNARYATLTFREVQQAGRISNSGPAFSQVSAEDSNRMAAHYEKALKYATARSNTG